MLLQRLFLASLLLLALAFGWRFWRSVAAEGPDTNARPGAPAIDFDNGSVRAPASATALAPGTVPGQLTKCVRGSETVYTHFTCPPGHKAAPMRGGTVTVVPGGAPAAKPPQGGSASAAGLPPNGAKASLHDALDISADPRLRERMVDRAVQNSR